MSSQPIPLDTLTRSVDSKQLPWAELAPGIEIKMLRVGEGSGTYSLLTRFAPGITLPRHRHLGWVYGYTIEGRWHYLEYDWFAEAGAYVYEPPGSIHTLAVCQDNAGPTTVLFIIDKGLELLDDSGRVFHVEEAQSMMKMYGATLEAKGLPRPDATLD